MLFRSLALPLIALQYHEVRINLEFNTLNNVCWDYSNSSDPHAIRNRVGQCGLAAASLYIDYIYLDTDERRKFAQVSHEYLIDTLQFTGGESINSTNNKLKFAVCMGMTCRAHTVDTMGSNGRYASLVLLANGNPAVAYRAAVPAMGGFNAVVRLARANNANPMASSDWTITDVATLPSACRPADCAMGTVCQIGRAHV